MTRFPGDMWDDAWLYELENADDPEFDLGFWSGLVRRLRPRRVLELACGTGRLTLPLARVGLEVVGDGFSIVGLDSSAPFLAEAASRLAGEPEPVRSAACLVEGDMRAPAQGAVLDAGAEPRTGLGVADSSSSAIAGPNKPAVTHRSKPATAGPNPPDLPGPNPPANAGLNAPAIDGRPAPAIGGPFDLIVVPFNSLAYLIDAADRAATLHAAHDLLAADGCFTFDLLAPRYDLLAEATIIGPPVVRMDADHAAPALGVKRLIRTSTDAYDPTTQTLSSVNRYEIHRTDGTVEHRITDLDWHIWFPSELELALTATGFRVAERFGGYDGEPWTAKARRMLWLCTTR